MAKKVVAQFDVKPREETFIVNHTTPREMTTLICGLLFKNFSSGSGAAAANSASPAAAGSNSTSNISLGDGVIACQFNNSVATNSLTSLATNNLQVTYFPGRGTINVRGGSAQQMEMIKEFIANNDKKQPQAYLEISIIELSESGSREFDNTWQVWSEFFSGTFDGKSTATNPLYPNFVRGEGYTVVDSAENKYAPLYSVSKYAGTPTIAWALSYIISNGKGRVLSNPRIMITNGQTSTIDLTSDYVKTITSQVMANAGGLAGAVQKTYTIANDEGIKVDLMPFISPEGYVTLNIKPNYSTVKEKVTDFNAVTKTNDLVATLLQRRNLDLKNIRIKDGETLILGGMMREDEQKNVSKIPVLGDLPGIGPIFRSSSTIKTKQELVIMITPKIIKDSEDIVKNQDSTL